MEITQFDHAMVLSLLPDRKLDAHKGNFGKILLLCGSEGYTGAAALSAMGALRSGAGLVYLGVPRSIYFIEAVKLTEAIVFPVSDDGGMFGEKSSDEIAARMDTMDAILIGPGIGQSKGAEKLILHVLTHFSGPIVLDADGINLVCKHKDVLRGRKHSTVLTPHWGEFSRLGGEISEQNHISAAELAKDLNCIVLLKGHETVVTDGNKCICTRTGNPGMATGGSGDVLAGIIVSLIGQGVPCLEAAACGSWLAGAAADRCAELIGQYGMLPSDVLMELPRLMK